MIRVPLDCGNHLIVLRLAGRALLAMEEGVDSLVQPDNIAGQLSEFPFSRRAIRSTREI